MKTQKFADKSRKNPLGQQSFIVHPVGGLQSRELPAAKKPSGLKEGKKTWREDEKSRPSN